MGEKRTKKSQSEPNTQEKKGGRPKPPSRQYMVQGSDIDTGRSLKEAMAEFALLQDDALESHYMNWAKHPVNYARLEDENAVNNLKQANDAYTLSMLMNCVSPLRQGIKASSLMQAWMSYKLIASINPSLEGDISRLCANLRQDVGNVSKNITGPAKMFVKPLMGSLDGFLANTSAQKMGQSVRTHMDEGTLDEMVMTPKQLAALKVTFMEQYYKDMRTSDRNPQAMKKDYDAALGHLQVIAKNSGFDMSVVAAEERHLVGLKIRVNPDYQNMFMETSDIYGAHPVLDENGLWSSRFETADGHEYTVGGKAAVGAFTPRPPIDTESVLYGEGNEPNGTTGAFVQNLRNRGERFAYMEMWLDSEDCPLSNRVKAQVKSDLVQYEKEYKELVEHQLMDDGVYKGSAREAKKAASMFWESTFDQAKETALELGRDDAEYCGFQLELHRIVDKEVLTKAGVKIRDNTYANIENNVESAELRQLRDYMEERARRHEGPEAMDVGTGVDIAVRMRENYLEDMTVDELSRLMIHTGANQQQGINNPDVQGANPTRGFEIPYARGIQGQISDEDVKDILSGIDQEDPGEMGSPKQTKENKKGKKTHPRDAHELDDIVNPDTDVPIFPEFDT